jgi:arylsulfatase A-like enzyme
MGVNGHPLVKTPHLDSLARDGANFVHAFTPNPVCSPARACLQTGAWATRHKVVTITGTEAFQSADPSLPVMTQLLADAGYRVGHVGKFHNEVSGGPKDHGAEEYIPGSAYRKWREEKGLPPQPRTNGWFGEVDTAISPEQSPLAWQADTVLGLMANFHGSGKPFFLRWDPVEPHLPNIVPEPYASLYPKEQIAPWKSFPDPLTNKPDVQRRTRERWGVDSYTWDDWRPIVQRYLGEISLLDVQIGRLLDGLTRFGVAENTLVIYSTDHGDMCGAHSMMDKHYVMYDDIMRVPLIVRWAGKVPAGKTVDSFVSHEIDIAKTVLTAAEITPPASFVGRDLVAEVNGKLPNPRQDIFSQYQGTHQGLYSQRMLRDRRWKYVYNPVSRDELYDLTNDPGEIVNRADDADCAEVLQRMRQRMGEWMAEIKDPLSPPLFAWKKPGQK